VKITSDEKKNEKNVFFYRSLIAQKKYTTVISEINDSSSNSLKAVKLLALYQQSSGSNREKVIADIKQLAVGVYDPYVSLMASLIYFNEQNFDDALRSINNSSDLERFFLFFFSFFLFSFNPKKKKKLTETINSKFITKKKNSLVKHYKFKSF